MAIELRSARYPAWIVWLVGVPLLLLALAAAIFFFTLFLIGFGLIAIALGLRLWWWRRKLRRQSPSTVLEGEYVVVREPRRDDGTQPDVPPTKRASSRKPL